MDYEEKEWRERILTELVHDAEFEHPVANMCEYISFVSYSNGRGRKKRKRPREVELLTYGNRTYVLKTRITRDIEWVMKELFPWDMIPDHFGNDWYGAFLSTLRTMPKVRKNHKNGKKTLRHK